jgi:hypothetical protein
VVPVWRRGGVALRVSRPHAAAAQVWPQDALWAPDVPPPDVAAGPLPDAVARLERREAPELAVPPDAVVARVPDGAGPPEPRAAAAAERAARHAVLVPGVLLLRAVLVPGVLAAAPVVPGLGVLLLRAVPARAGLAVGHDSVAPSGQPAARRLRARESPERSVCPAGLASVRQRRPDARD